MMVLSIISLSLNEWKLYLMCEVYILLNQFSGLAAGTFSNTGTMNVFTFLAKGFLKYVKQYRRLLVPGWKAKGSIK
jgi:hypothetical protein